MTSTRLYQLRKQLPDLPSAAQGLSNARGDEMAAATGWQMVSATLDMHAKLDGLMTTVGISRQALRLRSAALSEHLPYRWCCPADRTATSPLLHLGGMLTRAVIAGLGAVTSDNRALASLARRRGGLIFPIESAPGLPVGVLVAKHREVTVHPFVTVAKGASGCVNCTDTPDGTHPWLFVTDFGLFAGLYDRLQRSSSLGTGLVWVPDFATATVARRAVGDDRAISVIDLLGPRSPNSINFARKLGIDAQVSPALGEVAHTIPTGELLEATPAETVLHNLRSTAIPWYEALASAADGLGPLDLSMLALGLDPMSADEEAAVAVAKNQSGASKLANLMSGRVGIRRFAVDRLVVIEHPSVGWSVEQNGAEERISDVLVRFDEVTMLGDKPVLAGVISAGGIQLPFSAPEESLRLGGLANVVTAKCVAQGIYPHISDKYRRRLFNIARAASNPVIRRAVSKVGWNPDVGGWEFPRVLVMPYDGGQRRVTQKPDDVVARAVHGVPGSQLSGVKPPPLALLNALSTPTAANCVVAATLGVCLYNLANPDRKLGLVVVGDELFGETVFPVGQQLGLLSSGRCATSNLAVSALIDSSNQHDLPVVSQVEWGLLTRKRLLERASVNIMTSVPTAAGGLRLSSYPRVAVCAVRRDGAPVYVDGCEDLLPYALSLVPSGPRLPSLPAAMDLLASIDKKLRWIGESATWLIADQCESHWAATINAMAALATTAKSPLDIGCLTDMGGASHALMPQTVVNGKLGNTGIDPYALEAEVGRGDAWFGSSITSAAIGWLIDSKWLAAEIVSRWETFGVTPRRS